MTGRQQDGGIITGWLLQIVVFMAVVAVIGYEAITIAVTTINLEDGAREVAQAGARAYGSQEQLGAAREAAAAEAADRGIEVVTVQETDGSLTVTVRERADTLFVHRISAFDDLAIAEATGSARWQP